MSLQKQTSAGLEGEWAETLSPLLKEIDNQAVLEAYGIDVSILVPKLSALPTVIHNLDASEDVDIAKDGEDLDDDREDAARVASPAGVINRQSSNIDRPANSIRQN